MSPDLNPAEGIWSLLKQGAIANFAAADQAGLVRIIKRKLRKIHAAHLIDGCLAATGLKIIVP